MHARRAIKVCEAQGLTPEEIVEKLPPQYVFYYLKPQLYRRAQINEYSNVENPVYEIEADSDLTVEDLKVDLEKVMRAKLTENEIKVIKLTYGIGFDYSIKDIKGLSKKLGIPKEEVKSLRDSANEKLREDDALAILAKYL
jgi:DNA-directed RNA polymerase sigma subunit (sigma70/sigma32)